MWECRNDGTVVNFSERGGRVFLSMGKILIHYFQAGKFTGDLMGRIQIRYDLTDSFTSPVIQENDYANSSYGLETDILHFRHMIAQVILKSLGKDFEPKLSASLKKTQTWNADIGQISNVRQCHPLPISLEISNKIFKIGRAHV